MDFHQNISFRFQRLNLRKLAFLAALIVLGGRQAGATEYTSTNFKVIDPVISVGGGRSTSNTYQAEQSFGQPATGISSSASFELKGGLLYFATPSAATPSPTPTPAATPSAVGTGGPLSPSKIVFPALQFLLPPAEIPKKCPEGFEPSDLNCDKKVDLKDLSIFLYFSSIPEPEKFSPADLNRDAKVDTRDLSILFSQWNGKFLTFTPESQIKALADRLNVAAPEGGLAFVGGGKVRAASAPALPEERETKKNILKTLISFVAGLFAKLASLMQALIKSILNPAAGAGLLPVGGSTSA